MFLWDLNISFQFSTADPERCRKDWQQHEVGLCESWTGSLILHSRCQEIRACASLSAWKNNNVHTTPPSPLLLYLSYDTERFPTAVLGPRILAYVIPPLHGLARLQGTHAALFYGQPLHRHEWFFTPPFGTDKIWRLIDLTVYMLWYNFLCREPWCGGWEVRVPVHRKFCWKYWRRIGGSERIMCRCTTSIRFDLLFLLHKRSVLPRLSQWILAFRTGHIKEETLPVNLIHNSLRRFFFSIKSTRRGLDDEDLIQYF